MRVLVVDPFLQLVCGVFGHNAFGLVLESGTEGVVEGSFDAIDGILIEGDGVEVGMEVHVGSIGSEDVDQVA